jgi:hypothetical protein
MPQQTTLNQPSSAIQPRWQGAIDGRYRRFTLHQLAMLWWLYQERHITARQLRIVFAFHEMDERRSYLDKDQYRVLSLAELRHLIGVGEGGSTSDAALTSDLRRLGRLGVLQTDSHQVRFATTAEQLSGERIELDDFWSFFHELPNSHRTIPVPRRLLRALAGGFTRSMTGTIIAYLIRCLFWHKNENAYRVDGRAKASWIAEMFGLSRRAVIDARARLVELGWLVHLPAAQWELNRWGGRYAINTAWADGEDAAFEASFAPPQKENASSFAPPDKQISSPNREAKKTRRPTFGGPAGASHKTTQEKEAVPRINNILPNDLRDDARTQDLYQHACGTGQANTSEHGRLQFFSLVERARARGQEPCRLLAWLLRHQRFDFITQSDEDAAAARIKRHDFGIPNPRERTRGSHSPPCKPSPEPSQDARRYMAVLQAIQRSGTPLAPATVAHQHLGWDLPRWQQAEADYWAWQQDKATAVGGRHDFGALAGCTITEVVAGQAPCPRGPQSR